MRRTNVDEKNQYFKKNVLEKIRIGRSKLKEMLMTIALVAIGLGMIGHIIFHKKF